MESKSSSHFINHRFNFKNNHFSLVCVEDEDVLPDLSSTDVIIKELENYSNIRAHVNRVLLSFKFL